MKRAIPILLTTLRLLLGPLALVVALQGWPWVIFAPILVTATLSDIYDGVLARRFGVATPTLRRYDSATDIVYYLFILGCIWILCRPALSAHWPGIALLLSSEAAVVLVSLARFRAFPATHSYLAKFYGLSLLACCLGLLAFDAPGWTMVAQAAVGTLANTEILAILFLSRKAPVDVPSIFAMTKKSRGHL